MAERGLDTIVVQGSTDPLSGYVKWLTGFGSGGYRKVVLFHANDAMTTVEHGVFGGRKRIADDEEHPGVGEMITTSAFASVDYTNGYEARLAVDEFTRRGSRKVGLVGPTSMPEGFAVCLRQGLAGKAELSDETEFFDFWKAVKSEEEVAELRETCALQDRVFAKVLESIRPGMRDFEVVALADYHCRLEGSAQGIVLGSSAKLGTPAVFRETQSQGRTLERGDHYTLLIEMNGAGGYYAEVARTIVLGKAPAELLEILEMLKEAQAYSVRRFQDGASCRDVARQHDDFMRQRGAQPELRLYAHGQGYDLVERPLIRHDEPMKLAGNMFLACHPGYLSSSVFATVCDDFWLPANGVAERVHMTPQKIFEV
jgi:Xaa-Pro aminopeptidase